MSQGQPPPPPQASPPPPPGWFPDPHGQAPLRWWDGSRWTEHTSHPQEPPPAKSRSGCGTAALIIVVIVGLLGALLVASLIGNLDEFSRFRDNRGAAQRTTAPRPEAPAPNWLPDRPDRQPEDQELLEGDSASISGLRPRCSPDRQWSRVTCSLRSTSTTAATAPLPCPRTTSNQARSTPPEACGRSSPPSERADD